MKHSVIAVSVTVTVINKRSVTQTALSLSIDLKPHSNWKLCPRY